MWCADGCSCCQGLDAAEGANQGFSSTTVFVAAAVLHCNVGVVCMSAGVFTSQESSGTISIPSVAGCGRC